jgi:hypothetical protein
MKCKRCGGSTSVVWTKSNAEDFTYARKPVLAKRVMLDRVRTLVGSNSRLREHRCADCSERFHTVEFREDTLYELFLEKEVLDSNHNAAIAAALGELDDAFGRLQQALNTERARTENKIRNLRRAEAPEDDETTADTLSIG